ncbi:TetR/AcrR family transcriptional regulator [Brenneria roseae subsp. roseae]|uniref:TetR/AcrR family transcriptional regulator n=1 Tax=Brenneria roseae TaxID=1509241 RepID=UPI000D6061E5|nr:TetR/AcrR family transcriptional regulator [Brenneria roseae]PWC23082.1 TetR/AcrR family transcriptional regulator [Brenneria roseae subsp. roseae]
MKDIQMNISEKNKIKNDKEKIRRSAILESAEKLFIEHGINRTTTTMIASKAMVSKRAIYDSFKTKDDIYYAVMEKNKKYLVDLPRPDDEDLPIFDTLVKIFRLDLDSEEEAQRILFLQYFRRESAESPEMTSRLYSRGVFNPREQLIQWIERQVQAGKISIHEQDDLNIYAGMLMNIVFGALTPPRSGHDDLITRKKHIAKALLIFLKGINHNVSVPAS